MWYRRVVTVVNHDTIPLNEGAELRAAPDCGVVGAAAAMSAAAQRSVLCYSKWSATSSPCPDTLTMSKSTQATGIVDTIPIDPSPQKESQLGSHDFDSNGVSRVKRTRVGVWDFHHEFDDERTVLPGAQLQHTLKHTLEMAPHAKKLLRQVLEIAPFHLFIYAMGSLIGVLAPAVTLHFTGQLLSTVSIVIQPSSLAPSLHFSRSNFR